MGRFSEKLDGLASTISMCLDVDVACLSDKLLHGRDRPVVAVGSGGSAISAEYLRRCRETCSFARTAVETPMEFVTDLSSLNGFDVWLFTAGAENADVLAAVQTAYRRGATQVFMITKNPKGRVALRLKELGGDVFAVPASNEKDGFLATHSLVATISVLLMAFDGITDAPFDGQLKERFIQASKIELGEESREHYRNLFSTLKADDTLLVIGEPQLSPISSLIDTSVWEAAICNVQSTDFRNFAHGRHTWLHHRPETSFVIALTGCDWRTVHSAVVSAIPHTIRKSVVDFGNCGRFENAVGIVRGLAMIEAMGFAVDVDPGKPGVGQFGREIYEDEALYSASTSLKSAVRHKYAAVQKQDTIVSTTTNLSLAHSDRIAFLRTAKIGAIVLDYDGTVVSTEDRLKPPSPDIIEQFFRLRELGILVAIATGRGGSVGEDLRQVFPVKDQKDILIGYYNGAYLQPLDVDIDAHRPEADPDIDKAIEWMELNNELFSRFRRPKQGVQVAIQKSDLISPSHFEAAISDFLPSVANRLRLDRSAHSYDLVVSRASKLNVVKAIEPRIPTGAVVLCLGDSGTVLGNDHELISSVSGISVDAVCCDRDGSWTVFGYERSGPEALLKVLTSLVPSDKGCVQFAADGLK